MQNIFLIVCLAVSLMAGCASAPDTPTTRNKEKHTFGFIQVRGTPNYFVICQRCPAVTPKTMAQKKMLPPTRRFIKTTPPVSTKVVAHFDHASSTLQADDLIVLSRLAKDLPETYQLTITGYTDSTGRLATNKKLARQRAQVVTDYLGKLGLNKDQFTLKATPLSGYIASNTTEAGRAKNRRTEIIISALTNEGIQS